MNDRHNKRAKEILETIKYATLATVTPEGKPWNSPVASILDKDLNIYWFSDKEGQHSKNVRANGEVFIVIYDSTVPEGQGEGVYIQARAHELNDAEEIRAAQRIKKGTGNDDPAEFMDNAVRRAYKAIPQRVWMNDDITEDGVFIKDIRVEVPLETLRAG
ncbi:MAG TPA: pyridoxamine 5'-phosphate oxidase family protein [Candidatus Saccharimonadales bacterium]|nr:pyridoxamine 5'-phosphate oxidase family protein [Candidatus Saccharimonadales bacterium]